jgi:5-methylcytosine-specific restriction endonuclease McrA
VRLTYDFSSLWFQVDRLNVEREPFSLHALSLGTIDVELSGKGIEVDLDAIQNIAGLTAYEGRQILLYIPDQGHKIEAVLQGDREAGTKFHVAHCQTLRRMKRQNRYERYVATTNVEGIFDVAGVSYYSNVEMMGTARLLVCQHCLNMLNYKQSKVAKSAWTVRNDFDIEEFFETYSSCFPYLPSRTRVRAGDSSYAENWDGISLGIRISVDWRCEKCSVNLRDHKNLLHVHHIDGVKSNNSRLNLRALCKACHRDEPNHQTMYMPRSEMALINRLRREQGLLKNNWSVVMKHADPATHGILGLLKDAGWSAPEVEFQYDPKNRHFIDLAWTNKRTGIYLANEPLEPPRGWKFYNLEEALRIYS